MTTKSNNDQFGQEPAKPNQDKAAAYMIASHLLMLKSQIESLINKIPTSEARNDVCDANIHLSSAIEKLKEAASKIAEQPNN